MRRGCAKRGKERLRTSSQERFVHQIFQEYCVLFSSLSLFRCGRQALPATVGLGRATYLVLIRAFRLRLSCRSRVVDSREQPAPRPNQRVQEASAGACPPAGGTQAALERSDLGVMARPGVEESDSRRLEVFLRKPHPGSLLCQVHILRLDERPRRCCNKAPLLVRVLVLLEGAILHDRAVIALRPRDQKSGDVGLRPDDGMGGGGEGAHAPDAVRAWHS